jgi:hypothetical protein
MQHTALKQIKYNRGQVTDKLSERSDMGLQNACGTVYDNIYINRYGQLQNAPCLEMATTNGGSYMNIVALWYDESASTADMKIYYPIALTRGTGSHIALKIYSPIKTIRKQVVTPVLNIPTGEEDIKTILSKTDLSTPIATYDVDRPWSTLESKIFQFGSNFVVYGQQTNPWLFNLISSGVADPTIVTTNYYGWQHGLVGSSGIYENETTTYYINGMNPVTIDLAPAQYNLGSFTLVKGSTYTNGQYFVSAGGGGVNVWIEISSGSAILKGNTVNMFGAQVVPVDISSDFIGSVFTTTTTPSVADSVYNENFAVIGTIESVSGSTFVYNTQTYSRYADIDTTNSVEVYSAPTVNVKDGYFDGAFQNIFVRGINIETPSDFTPPTSGNYFVTDDSGITTKKIITIARNNAGSAFTQDLVGQVINCPQLSGAVQVREVVNGNTLKAYVLSPLIAANDSTTQIDINFDSSELTAKWMFGYERPFSDTNGYPDSVCYVNQRLVFGGNDKFGNLIAASRIGVINDFDPSDATESDSFSASISTPQACRVVDFVQSNDELRIATTYGEYAVSLSAFTPTGIVQSGFHLRSQVGVKKDTPICDCGGLTAYVSNDGNSIHVTQFSLLQNKYSPISLTSQTEGIVNNCNQMVYLRNRDNDEGNLLVGLTALGTVFGISIDTNAGLNAAYNIYKQDIVNSSSFWSGRIEGKITRLFALENVLFAQFTIKNTIMADTPVSRTYLVKFSLNRIFDLAYGYTAESNAIELPLYVADLAFPQESESQTSGIFVALYKDGESYSLIKPTGYVCDYPDVNNPVAKLTFETGIDQSKIITAGFIRQADWRSVELSLGMTTRELNKKIVKLSSVVEPIRFYGDGDYIEERYSIPQESTYKFFNLVVGKETSKLTDEQINNSVKTIFSEGEDMSWRRGFDNPSRELHYGITMLAPFLIKSTTAVLEYDDVA